MNHPPEMAQGAWADSCMGFTSPEPRKSAAITPQRMNNERFYEAFLLL